MTLTNIQANQATPRDKDYKLSDEKGLFLLVKKSGAKYWRFKYRYAGKEKNLALGVFPEITLKMARNKRDKARLQIADGIDPGEARRAAKEALVEAGTNSFKVIALEWFNTKMKTKSQGHQDRTLRALEKDLFPHLGNLPVSTVKPKDLLRVLRKIESRGALETAKRAKQTCGQIFRFAVATGRADRDPAADLKDALQLPVKKHLAAITNSKDAGGLLVAIDNYEGTPTVQAALKLSPLFFCRPGELRHLEWAEVNWEEKQIEIAGEKMKMGEPHIIPLCKQALVILKELELLTGRFKYVFPSARGASRPLSENGVRTALRSMGYDNDTMTPHGFRAMARTLLDEVLGFRVDWIEHQLAHAVKDANGRAYNRTSHLPQRKKMMQRWADYLDSLKKSDNVIQMFAKKN
ncbi:tyrosine-type recombinase/integrase [Aurantivibrio infirmus]